MLLLSVPQVAVIGPPVSGKWCVANKIANTVQTPHLDPEGIIEDAPKELQLETSRYTEQNEVSKFLH